MEKHKPFILLGAGVMLAILISMITYGWLQQKSRVQVKTIETQPVVVAIVDIPWGTVLTAPMLKTQPFLKNSLPQGCFTAKNAVEGRTIIYPIKAGEPIFESRLAPTTIQAGGVSALVTPNKRAMAVKVDKVTGVSGFVHPGNRVDVLVTLSRQGNSSENRAITKTVLENVLVLATGTDLDKSSKQEKAVQVDVITVEVTPEEGEKLALAATEGKLQMALRNALDSQEVSTKGSTIPTLLTSFGSHREKPGKKEQRSSRAVAPSEKERPFVVELIKGSSISPIKFEKGRMTDGL